MIEEWKVYKESKYTWEISNLGRVKKNGLIIKPRIQKPGYLKSVNLVHRMVAEMFIPNTENKPCVDHIDGNKLNNIVDNLRWVTYKENMNNPITLKTLKDNQPNRKGENNPCFGLKRTEESKEKQRQKMLARHKLNIDGTYKNI